MVFLMETVLNNLYTSIKELIPGIFKRVETSKNLYKGCFRQN
jgi:hypothetical protein